jgi:hypothetical protein
LALRINTVKNLTINEESFFVIILLEKTFNRFLELFLGCNYRVKETEYSIVVESKPGGGSVFTLSLNA